MVTIEEHEEDVRLVTEACQKSLGRLFQMGCLGVVPNAIVTALCIKLLGALEDTAKLRDVDMEVRKKTVDSLLKMMQSVVLEADPGPIGFSKGGSA